MCPDIPGHADFKVLVGGTMQLERFCEEKLLSLWKSMQRRFNLLHEELEYLIVEVMVRFVQVRLLDIWCYKT